MTVYWEIADALVAGARADLARARLAAMERPHGEKGIDVDFFSRADRDQPVQTARWAAYLMVWDGKALAWRHKRRLTTALSLEAALAAAGGLAKLKGIPRI